MTAEPKKIFEQALGLPEEDCATLMDALNDCPHEAAGELSPERKAEIERPGRGRETG